MKFTVIIHFKDGTTKTYENLTSLDYAGIDYQNKYWLYATFFSDNKDIFVNPDFIEIDINLISSVEIINSGV